MAEPAWKEWPEECPECGFTLEVFSEDTCEAWAYDGDPVRCPNCGATGQISCSAEDDCYVLMHVDQPTSEENLDG
jgi:DNA-directed RNA polymerase subunit RPC12/RpoP